MEPMQGPSHESRTNLSDSYAVKGFGISKKNGCATVILTEKGENWKDWFGSRAMDLASVPLKAFDQLDMNGQRPTLYDLARNGSKLPAEYLRFMNSPDAGYSNQKFTLDQVEKLHKMDLDLCIQKICGSLSDALRAQLDQWLSDSNNRKDAKFLLAREAIQHLGYILRSNIERNPFYTTVFEVSQMVNLVWPELVRTDMKPLTIKWPWEIEA